MCLHCTHLSEFQGDATPLHCPNGQRNDHVRFNSLWPCDAIWWHRSRSTLAQVMACCLMAPSHYMNQCWLLICVVLWHSLESNYVGNAQVFFIIIGIWKLHWKLLPHLLWAIELNFLSPEIHVHIGDLFRWCFDAIIGPHDNLLPFRFQVITSDNDDFFANCSIRSHGIFIKRHFLITCIWRCHLQSSTMLVWPKCIKRDLLVIYALFIRKLCDFHDTVILSKGSDISITRIAPPGAPFTGID